MAWLLFVSWYAWGGLLTVLMGLIPGVLVRIEDDRPAGLSVATWTVVGLAWPYFVARWTINTLKDRNANGA